MARYDIPSIFDSSCSSISIVVMKERRKQKEICRVRQNSDIHAKSVIA